MVKDIKTNKAKKLKKKNQMRLEKGCYVLEKHSRVDGIKAYFCVLHHRVGNDRDVGLNLLD